MGFAVIKTRGGEGIDAPLIQVEVHLANGLPKFNLVGMAQTSVKEARDRVRSALMNSNIEFPAKRITVNLAPTTLPKQGSRYDLPIAIGILCALGIVKTAAVQDCEFIGELSLDGQVKGVQGALPAMLACAQVQRTLVCAPNNQLEANLIEGSCRLEVANLTAVIAHFNGQNRLPVAHGTGFKRSKVSNTNDGQSKPIGEFDRSPRWDDIIGQPQAKRALQIAAAGRHNLLLVGPPGTGKSLLANRLVSLLPDLNVAEALELAAIRSIKGEQICPMQIQQRPFRSPHHTSTALALTGGGGNPLPGEVSLAHHGVLFLDELPEFGRKTLDVLREPLETGDVHIARAARGVTYPAKFQLVAAMNPSPTGDFLDGRTNPEQTLRYLNRLSGPFLDRIDLQVEVPKVDNFDLFAGVVASLPAEEGIQTTESLVTESGMEDSAIAAKLSIAVARERQLCRQTKVNAELDGAELINVCDLSHDDNAFFRQAASTLKLSIRVFHRLLKVARTIADLEQSERVQREHLLEALGYRCVDKMIAQLSSS